MDQKTESFRRPDRAAKKEADRRTEQVRLRRKARVRSSAPSNVQLALRPFGYLGMAMVYAALAAVSFYVTVLLIPVLVVSDSEGALPLGTGPMIKNTLSSVGETIGALIAVPLVAAILGYATLALVFGTLALCFLSLTYFVRSLRPAYRSERLSFTSQSAPGASIGPAAGSAALSMVPLRQTAWTRFLMLFYDYAWNINLTVLLLGLIYGAEYFFTLGWLAWPAQGAGTVLCGTISAGLAVGFFVVLYLRRGKPTPGRSA